MFSEKFKKLKVASFIKTPNKDSEITLDVKEKDRTVMECVVCLCKENSEALSLDLNKESLEPNSKLAQSLGVDSGQKPKRADYVYLSPSQAAVVELKKRKGSDLEKMKKEAFKQIKYTIDHHLSALDEDCENKLMQQIKGSSKVKEIIIVMETQRKSRPCGFGKKEPRVLYIYNKNCISEEEFLK